MGRVRPLRQADYWSQALEAKEREQVGAPGLWEAGSRALKVKRRMGSGRMGTFRPLPLSCTLPLHQPPGPVPRPRQLE